MSEWLHEKDLPKFKKKLQRANSMIKTQITKRESKRLWKKDYIKATQIKN